MFLPSTSLPARCNRFTANVGGLERGQAYHATLNTWKTKQNKCNRALDKGLRGIMVHERKISGWAWQLHWHPLRDRERNRAWWSWENSKEAQVCGTDTGWKEAAQSQVGQDTSPIDPEKFLPHPPFLGSSQTDVWIYLFSHSLQDVKG